MSVTYTVETSTTSATGPWTTAGTASSTAGTLTITSLTPGVTYWFRITASSAFGTSAPSDVVSVTALAASPSTPWVNLESALWDWLAADAAFGELGLKQYRGYLGQFFPLDEITPDSVATSTAVPCIVTEPGEFFGRAGNFQTNIQGRLRYVCDVNVRVVYGTSRGDHDRLDFEQAVATVIDRIAGTDARKNWMGAGSSVEGYEVLSQSMTVERRNGVPILWVWTASIRLADQGAQVGG